MGFDLENKNKGKKLGKKTSSTIHKA